LGKLIALYDDQQISMTARSRLVQRRHAQRFEAYGWHVISNVDGHDVESVDARSELQRRWRTNPAHLLQNRDRQGGPDAARDAKAHGEALGAEEVAATRAAIGWRYPPFEIPQASPRLGREKARRGARASLNDKFAAYEKRTRSCTRVPPSRRGPSCRRLERPLRGCSNKSLPRRNHRHSQGLAERYQGSRQSARTGRARRSDRSNLTLWSGSKPSGGGGRNYIYYGVREFA